MTLARSQMRDEHDHLARPIGVVRVADEKNPGYRVAIAHRGAKRTRFFSDRKHHNATYAWAAACSWLLEERRALGSPWKYVWQPGQVPPKGLQR